MFFFAMSISCVPYMRLECQSHACSPDSVCARLRTVTTRKTAESSKRTVRLGPKPVSLKQLAEHLQLSPATVSLVINRSPVADSIPQETKDRVLAAARKYKYRPNFFARSLRSKHSLTIGVIVPEVSEDIPPRS